MHRKLQIYYACIATKVLYGLETLSITSRDVQRLQAFEHRIVRRKLRIPVSMISHVSNEEVMRQAKSTKCLPNMLLHKQLQLLGHLVRATPRDPSRVVCLEPHKGISMRSLSKGVQRVGYRTSEWWFHRARGQISGDFPIECAMDRAEWRRAIQRRCEGPVSRWRLSGLLS